MVGWRELLILLLIVLVVFGARRLRNIGEDLGSAVKGFKKGMADPEPEPPQLGKDPAPPAARSTDAESAQPGDGDRRQR